MASLTLREATTADAPTHTTTTKSRKDEAYEEWAASFIPRRNFPAWASIVPPNGNKPPPFIQGALTAKNRRLWSTCVQLTNRHCFDANYSMRFRSHADDIITCPCMYSYMDSPEDPDRHSDGLAAGGRPTRGRTHAKASNRRNDASVFEGLMQRYLNPEDNEPARPRSTSAPLRHVLHTVEHVLTSCPLTTSFRDKFLRNMSISEIFGTELGASRLCRFLHFSQTLQRPLPPRPDPP